MMPGPGVVGYGSAPSGPTLVAYQTNTHASGNVSSLSAPAVSVNVGDIVVIKGTIGNCGTGAVTFSDSTVSNTYTTANYGDTTPMYNNGQLWIAVTKAVTASATFVASYDFSGTSIGLSQFCAITVEVYRGGSLTGTIGASPIAQEFAYGTSPKTSSTMSSSGSQLIVGAFAAELSATAPANIHFGVSDTQSIGLSEIQVDGNSYLVSFGAITSTALSSDAVTIDFWLVADGTDNTYYHGAIVVIAIS